MDDGVDRTMPIESPLAVTTAQPMGAATIHLRNDDIGELHRLQYPVSDLLQS